MGRLEVAQSSLEQVICFKVISLWLPRSFPILPFYTTFPEIPSIWNVYVFFVLILICLIIIPSLNDVVSLFSILIARCQCLTLFISVIHVCCPTIILTLHTDTRSLLLHTIFLRKPFRSFRLLPFRRELPVDYNFTVNIFLLHVVDWLGLFYFYFYYSC